MPEFDFEKYNTVEIDSFEDTVPGKYRGLYERASDDNGNEVYQISGDVRNIVNDYIGTSKALDKARADKKNASDESAGRRKTIQAFEDFASSLGLEVGDDGVVAALQSHVEDLVGQVKGGQEMRVNLDKIKQDYEKKQAEALAVKDREIKDRDAALERHLISDVATREIANAKGKVKVLMPHVKSQCKVVRDENGDYAVRVVDSQGDFRSNGAGGWMNVSDLVAEVKTDPDFAANFESDTQLGGTGKRPTDRKSNPLPRQTGEDRSANQKIAAGLDRLVQSGGKRAGIGS